MKLNDRYEAKKYEQDIYAKWQNAKLFKANPKSSKKHYSISMPPPNETGTLHLGHALFITLQDILIRHARAKNYDALWLPGTDHAAIATNAIIEKQLAEEETTKHQIGREVFLKRTRAYVGNSRDTINSQIRTMGASVDWSRSRYTLDPTLNRVVSEVFIKMYDDGLIYRGNRIVNWDPLLETNVSDDEVEYKEEKTKLYTFKFGPFEISTTRPETKFGDKYVVINPKDKRYLKYKHLDTFETEWINGKITATIIKDEAIDPKFGTGVMTITPWHSLVDFEIANRHNLDKEQVIGLDGKLLAIANEFAGMKIEDAREKIVEKMRQKGLLIDIDENYLHNIALNSRGKGIIEPQIRLQWFIDVNKKAFHWKGQKASFKEVLQRVIREGDVKIIPSNFEKVYFHWIDNLRDWCISRQIWWGHRLPVWYDKEDNSKLYIGLDDPNQTTTKNVWIQDPDTLDTWFSSSLWSFSTLIDPELAKDPHIDLSELLKRSPDFNAYHPTDVLETGWDILFFWAARMILATTYITNQVPFKTIYLHGLVRTEQGKKMSKSDPDSIIDPIEVIKEYGTDALRLALIQGMSAGKDQRLGTSKIITNRNFCNKLWNVARFIEDRSGPYNSKSKLTVKSSADNWIITKINDLQDSVIKSLDDYQFSEAYYKIYHFLWDDLADWYIEYSKTDLNPELLNYILRQYLIIAHPLAPFISEVLWQDHFADNANPFLATQQYGEKLNPNLNSSTEFQTVIDIIGELRKITKALNLKSLNVYSDQTIFTNHAKFIITSSKIKLLDKKGTGFTKLQVGNTELWIQLDSALIEDYTSQLKTKIDLQNKELAILKKRLNNSNYLANAPEEVVQESKQLLVQKEFAVRDLIKELEIFQKL